MKRTPLLLLICSGLLTSCNIPSPPLPPQVSAPHFFNTPNLSAQNAPLTIEDIYPIQARRWTFTLHQTQNGKPNTKFKTLNMWTESLPDEKGAKQAILRRAYPDSTVVPKPSLIKQFPDRIELSRYQENQPTLALNLPTATPGFASPEATQNYIIALKLPLTANQSWEGRQFKGGSETIRIGNWETLQLPAGSFRALQIEHQLSYNNGNQDYLRYWYAKGIGMVKMQEELTVYFGQWLKLKSTGELTAYQGPNL